MSPEVTTANMQQAATPQQILEQLKAGNARFVSGQLTARDYQREIVITQAGQYPLAVVLSCMDSRVQTQLIFDLGLGDIFSIRVAGNVVSPAILGSIEYSCLAAGAKVILVLGHTGCGAVQATIDQLSQQSSTQDTQQQDDNLAAITTPIAQAIRAAMATHANPSSDDADFVQHATHLNVQHALEHIRGSSSKKLRDLIDDGEVLLCGAIYDIATGRVEFDNGVC